MAVPRMLKQWSSVIDGGTTIICLDAAGQIREVDELFETLNGEFMHPPAHIHCRAIVVPWLPGFVVAQRRPANDELARRPRKQRRKGPGGSTASNPPPDRSNPPGRRPPVAPVTPADQRRAARNAPSFEDPEGEDGEDVRTSDGMKNVLAGDAGEFRPTLAGGDPVAREIARQRGVDGVPRAVQGLADVGAFVFTWTVARQQRRSSILLRFTDHLDQLLRGAYRAGLGVFAAGIAFWIVAGDDDESELAAFGAQRLEARLEPAARVIDLEELRALQTAALERLDEEPATAERERWRRVISDLGRYALLLGYAAIRVQHVDGRVELIVVDRSALIVEEDS